MHNMFSACQHGWKFFAPNGRCYKHYSQNKTWHEAREYCRLSAPTSVAEGNSETGDLVSIPNRATNAFLTRLSKRWSWIGARKKMGQWKWSDGSRWRYESWANGGKGWISNIFFINIMMISICIFKCFNMFTGQRQGKGVPSKSSKTRDYAVLNAYWAAPGKWDVMFGSVRTSFYCQYMKSCKVFEECDFPHCGGI